MYRRAPDMTPDSRNVLVKHADYTIISFTNSRFPKVVYSETSWKLKGIRQTLASDLQLYYKKCDVLYYIPWCMVGVMTYSETCLKYP
jgi:hypothetical protein